jgi:hypothetical protein
MHYCKMSTILRIFCGIPKYIGVFFDLFAALTLNRRIVDLFAALMFNRTIKRLFD